MISSSSKTCQRCGASLLQLTEPPHPQVAGGLHGTILSACSDGSSSRVVPSWPGCAPRRRLRLPPPRRPFGLSFGGAQGGSFDGGLEEFEEFVPSFSSSSSTRARSSAFSALRASTAARACCSERSSFLIRREIYPLRSRRRESQAPRFQARAATPPDCSRGCRTTEGRRLSQDRSPGWYTAGVVLSHPCRKTNPCRKMNPYRTAKLQANHPCHTETRLVRAATRSHRSIVATGRTAYLGAATHRFHQAVSVLSRTLIRRKPAPLGANP